MAALIVAAMLFIGIVAESFAQEDRPQVVQGLADWARGRFITPETIPAVAMAYVFAAFMFVGGALIGTGDYAQGGIVSASEFANSFKLTMPSLGALSFYFTAAYMALSVAFAVLLLNRWKVTRRAALVLPAVIYMALTVVVVMEMGPWGLLKTGVSVVLLAIVVWRYGVIAGALAAAIASGLDMSLSLAAAGSTFVSAALITMLFIAVPAVLGIMSYRRYG